MAGKLIVFEGTDGSGKHTQLDLLVTYLNNAGIACETLDFPRYKKSFFGDLAGELLHGTFGPIEQVPAKLAALPFACDRWLVKNDLVRWLGEGKIVISNRYTASSGVYHAAKLPQSEQAEFISWVYKLEQEAIGLPKEDLVIYFHMPRDVAATLVNKRDVQGEKTKDMYEKDGELLATVEKLYLSLAEISPHWKTIHCTQDGQLRPAADIHKDVLDVLRENAVL